MRAGGFFNALAFGLLPTDHGLTSCVLQERKVVIIA